MTRKKESSPSKKPASADPAETVNNIRVAREYIEALVIALVLAFFFKAFAAEAFVIPTGSMATTLMGRHKDVRCEKCDYPFQINASSEMNESGDRVDSNAVYRPVVLAGTCPQCRHSMYVGDDNIEKKTFLSYNGDRIFVNKSQFDFREPTRWHVTVFRYPGHTQTNYIKRLVGVENETVMLKHGDVFVKKEGQDEFEIQRKPLRALLAMQRPVDDNDYVLADLVRLGWPSRWFDDEGHWVASEDLKSFRCADDSSGDVCWLSFRNIVPSSDDWYYLSLHQLPPDGMNHNPQLVTDFVSYNTEIMGTRNRRNGEYTHGSAIHNREVTLEGTSRKEFFCNKNTSALGLNWVGDLCVSARVTLEKAEGTLFLRLVKGGRFFQCEIDLSSGEARLSIPGVEEFPVAAAPTPVREASRGFELMFLNYDEEMRLVVDGREIDFQGKGRYDALCEPGGPIPRDRSPDANDLTPVAIGSLGAAATVEHLKVFRDLYYIAAQHSSDSNCDLIRSPFANAYSYESMSENDVARVLSTPQRWSDFGKTKVATFPLEKGQFLMLGDNSARSQDSRLWAKPDVPYYVRRDLLIGEAVFVYWPHGWRIPGTRIALIPNIGDVRFID